MLAWDKKQDLTPLINEPQLVCELGVQAGDLVHGELHGPGRGKRRVQGFRGFVALLRNEQAEVYRAGDDEGDGGRVVLKSVRA
jgi:hypothetical protein